MPTEKKSLNCPYHDFSSTACPHPLYQNHGFCIFHSPKVEEKVKDFSQALQTWLEYSESTDSIKEYNFQGFVFPRAHFQKVHFQKTANFQGSQFSGDAYFQESQFSGGAYFQESKFSGDAYFQESKFSGDAYFQECQFFGNTDFQDCVFSGTAIFSRSVFLQESKFSGDAYFQESKFSGDAYFQECQFFGNTDFQDCVFSGTAIFSRSVFLQEVDFEGTKFHHEIDFQNTQFCYLRFLKAEKLKLDGAILENIYWGWKNSKIENLSFYGTFLIACSFVRREIINCDFTGAVFDAVGTKGWKPDLATLKNTKYIYTDYTMEEEIVDEQTRRAYRIIEESRVPAQGNFEEGENKNFTLADYLRDPFKWSFALTLPPEIRTAVLNYIQFFSDFMRITQDIEVKIVTQQEGKKIRVEFMTDQEEDRQKVKDSFQQYLLQSKNEDLADIELKGLLEKTSSNELEQKIFALNYRSEIRNLKTKLESVELLLEAQKSLSVSEQEKNQLLRERIQDFQQTPQRLLPSLQKENRNLLLAENTKVPIFVLMADLASYSHSTSGNEEYYQKIQSFFLQKQTEVEKNAYCEQAKLAGDQILTFFTDGYELALFSEQLMLDLKRYARREGLELQGGRCILGYGLVIRGEHGQQKDFLGDVIVETARVDGAMKQYLKEVGEPNNQIWCTQSYYEEMKNEAEKDLQFTPIPQKLQFAKGYQGSKGESTFQLYQVKVL